MAEGNRVVIDCREYPESKCSLALSGTEQEVLDAAVHHAVTIHGMPEGPELKDKLRELLKPASEAA